jgi:hypothetical protein
MTSPAEWALSRSVQINSKLSVTMTAGPGGFTCEWAPAPPAFKQLNQRERERYCAGRDALLGEVAQRMGGNVLVVEI